jgi:hypothetical protein
MRAARVVRLAAGAPRAYDDLLSHPTGFTMARKEPKAQKSQIVAFKVEEELAKFLDNLPNKSEFIRKAILAQFRMTCPLCTGSGVVPRGIHDHYKHVLVEHDTRPCEKCKAEVTIPMSADAAPPADRRRFEQFLDGGPLYCTKCYPTVSPCDDCGWHVPTEKMVEHFKKVHSHSA